jgi:hypothetical protein
MLVNGAGGNLSFLLILQPIFSIGPRRRMWTVPMGKPLPVT